MEGLPAFATFINNGNGTGTIHAVPVAGDGGNYAITVVAKDNGGGNSSLALETSAQFILTALSNNEPPQLRFVGDKVAVIGEELVFAVSVSDLDQDPLTFSATGLPTSATFAGTNVYGAAEFRWTPTAGDSGSRAVTLKVTDSGKGVVANQLSDQETINIVVRGANQKPKLAPIGGRQLAEGQGLSILLTATDNDSDPLTFLARNLPDGATLNGQTGQFNWTPRFDQAGPYSVRFEASDGSRFSTRTF